VATQLSINEYIVLNAIFAKIDKTAFALASGLIYFLGMFVITAIIICKSTTPDMLLESNLQSLSYYLPGYSLTWVGNIIGSIYLGIIGALIGFMFAIFWNLVHYLYLAVIINKLGLLTEE
jgi:hypothetical protein